MPKSCSILAEDRRELAGRLAGVGYSEVVIGSTKAVGPPSAAVSAKISLAKLNQEVSPAFVKW